ncbi:MAG: hypothetical protein AAFN07_15385 [Pseudomonadota bacterium]
MTIEDALDQFMRDDSETAYGDFLRSVERFVKTGGDIDRRLPRNETLLHVAAESGFDELIKFLLEAGADQLALDFAGREPAVVALDLDIDSALQQDESEVSFQTFRVFKEHGNEFVMKELQPKFREVASAYWVLQSFDEFMGT